MRFSRRTAFDSRENRIAQELESLRRSGADILDLTQSNPTDAELKYDDTATKEALTSDRILRYEASPKGVAEARTAVATYLDGRVDPNRIILTASTSEAYAHLFKLLCDPGESILAPRPSYPLIDVLAKLEVVEVRQYALHYDYGWGIDFDSVRAALEGSQARALLVVNPNNPTGSFLERADYCSLVEVCVENGLALICDEVFSDYAFPTDSDRLDSIAGKADVLTFALSGLSKVCGLPQMKLAWIAASGPSPAIEEAMERLEWIADAFLSPGAPVQWGAARLLAVRGSIQTQIRERIQRNLGVLKSRTAGSPLNVLRVDGGWYATVQVPRVRSEEEWVIGLLRECGVLVQPGFFYDFEEEAYLILSLLTEPDVFDAGLAGLSDLATRLCG